MYYAQNAHPQSQFGGFPEDIPSAVELRALILDHACPAFLERDEEVEVSTNLLA
jgi:hypothetical protein